MQYFQGHANGGSHHHRYIDAWRFGDLLNQGVLSHLLISGLERCIDAWRFGDSIKSGYRGIRDCIRRLLETAYSLRIVDTGQVTGYTVFSALAWDSCWR
jgi:hypothetical protein